MKKPTLTENLGLSTTAAFVCQVHGASIKRSMLKFLREFPALTWVLFGLVVINVFQFSYIRGVSEKMWGALYRVENDNVFNEFETAMAETTVFSAFTAVSEFVDEPTIITDEVDILGTGRTEHNKARSILKADIRLYDQLKQRHALESLMENEQPKAMGNHWTSVAHRESGQPPIKWSIYAMDKMVEDLYFFTNPNGEEWFFIDKRVLSSYWVELE